MSEYNMNLEVASIAPFSLSCVSAQSHNFKITMTPSKKTQKLRIKNMQICACVSVASHCPGDSFLADIFEMLHPDSAVVLAAVWEQFDA